MRLRRGVFYKHKNNRDLVIEIIHCYEGTNTYSLNYYTYNCHYFELGCQDRPFLTHITRFNSKIKKEEISNWIPYSLIENKGILRK